jgi:hypothetical protein
MVAAVALVSASGASTAKTDKIARIDVSSRSAIVHYLRSIHVNPKGLVIQRGVHNYAGARCPGKRWTCTRTTHPVVQVARAGGKNVFRCSAARCAVVQVAAAAAKPNKATCVRTSGLGASCSITQSTAAAAPDGNNSAMIYENAGKKLTGLTQSASYTASIKQQATGAAASNTACVDQEINIDGSTNTSGKKGAAILVTLEAHQSVSITQDSLSGGNSANQSWDGTSLTCTGSAVTQKQTLTSTATGSGQIKQNENDAISACGDGVAGDNSNMCLDIEQNRSLGFKCTTSPSLSCPATGANSAVFDQESSLSAVANTPAGSVTQTQSSPDTSGFNGGLVGTINQDSTGVSTASATQDETQCEDAAPSVLAPAPGGCISGLGSGDFNGAYQLTQNQYGPEGVWKFRQSARGHRLYGHVDKGLGTATQTGNDLDTFKIVQTSKQDNDQGSNGSTSNQTNNVEGDCSTPGNCTDTQNININGTQSTNTQSGSDVNTSTNCIGSSCTSTCNNTSCTTFTQSGAQLTATDTEIKEFGYGGMRGDTGGGPTGDGTGSIAVSGITGPVSKALLFWNGPTDSNNANSNATVSFGGQSITGANIGTAASNCWGAANGEPYTNSQSYEADVTTLVGAGLTSGSGTFDLADFIKRDESNNIIADINGVSLIVFYNDGNAANWRNVVLWSGNDSNVADENDTPDSWSETLTGVPWPGSGSASLDFIVGDGQNFGGDSTDDGAISVNATQIVPEGGIFQGAITPAGPADASGNLWDVKSFSLPSSFLSTLTTGSNTLQVTAPYVNDCLSLVAVAANMPASAPPPVLLAPIAPVQKQARSPISQAPVAVSAFGGGGLIRRK